MLLGAMTNVLAFGWEPEVRGITAVLIAVLVLMGSTWLLLATNSGARLGMLIALAALFGWMSILGGIWWVYGIGLKGTEASWQAEEIVSGGFESASSSQLVTDPDLTAWELLPADDPGRGQAVAAADAFFINPDTGVFEATTDYVVTNVYRKGGDTYFLTFLHRPHYALVQVYPAVPQVTEPGKAPPTPVADTSQPATYLLMIRDLGDKRFPSAMITLGSLAIFLVLAYTLHRRDKLAQQHRSTALEKA